MAEWEIPENAVKRRVKQPSSIGEYHATLAKRYKYTLIQLQRKAGHFIPEDEDEAGMSSGLSYNFQWLTNLAIIFRCARDQNIRLLPFERLKTQRNSKARLRKNTQPSSTNPGSPNWPPYIQECRQWQGDCDLRQALPPECLLRTCGVAADFPCLLHPQQ
jgi:hypothetical protein